jgi:hypothetical protein
MGQSNSKLPNDDAIEAHAKSDKYHDGMNPVLIENASTAVRFAFLINGAAVLALVAFFTNGNFTSNEAALTGGPRALTYFASGVGAAALASAFAYFTNFGYTADSLSRSKVWEEPYVVPTPRSKRWRRFGIISHFLGIITTGSALVLFFVGLVSMHNAFQSFIGLL